MLEINSITVWYESMAGDIKALDRCSLAVRAGEITCLLGRNGAGKTTLFRTITGGVTDFDGKRTSGEITFAGNDITRCSTREIISGGIGLAPQGRHIFHTLSVEDNLRLGTWTRGRKGSTASEREGLALVFGLFPILEERRRQRSGTLSGGEQQMLAMGRALMARPRLLVLDEPFMGLAPVVIDEIVTALDRLRQGGTTLLLAEQNATAALSVCDTVFLMEEGFITGSGDAHTIREQAEVRHLLYGSYGEAP